MGTKRTPTPAAGTAATGNTTPPVSDTAAGSPAQSTGGDQLGSEQSTSASGSEENGEPVALFGSSRLPSLLAIDGTDVQLGTVVVAAFERSGLDTEAWNTLPEQTRDELLVSEAHAMGWSDPALLLGQGGSEVANGTPERVEARVLMAVHGCEPNDIVTLTRAEASAAEQAGEVDTHPDAVAYAKSLRA